MTVDEAIICLSDMKIKVAIPKAAVQAKLNNDALDMAIEALNCSEIPNNSDTISRQQAIDKFINALEEIFSDIRERHVDDSVCGLCEYDGAYIGQSGDWCNECPGFDRDDCFKLSDKTRKKWTDEIIKALPPVQPERKTGHWILDRSGKYCCNRCMEPCATYAMMKPRDKYCKMCGSRNEVTE